MKTAGILGGLGPQSTALFYEEIIRLSQRRRVVEYPKMIINSMSIWDFADKMNDKTQLYNLLSAEMRRIEKEVDFLAMVCNTAHSVIEQLRASCPIPLLAIQEEVVKKVRQDGLRKVGIMGTKITSNSHVYKNELDRYGIESVALPDCILDTFNQLIFEEMLRGQSYERMHAQLILHAHRLMEQGCEGIILGCTELPLFISEGNLPVPIYKSTQILAESVVEQCLGVEVATGY